jgi:type IV secretory pathway VirB4 component
MQNRNRKLKPVADGRNIEVIFADSLQQLEAKMTEQLVNYRHDRVRFEQLKEVIQSMLDRLDEGQTMNLTKDSVYVLALREAFK